MISLSPGHEAGASHRLGPETARLAAARERRREPCATLGITALRVPEMPQRSRQPELRVGIGAGRLLECRAQIVVVSVETLEPLKSVAKLELWSSRLRKRQEVGRMLTPDGLGLM